MANLIDTIRGVITPDVLRSASSVIGESETATHNLFNGAIPSSLAGALELGSTQAGAERLGQMISDGGYGAETVSGFSRLLGDTNARQSLESSGGQLLSSLFGGRGDAVTDAVARAGGVKKSAASHLMRLVTPLVMGAIGKVISSRGLDARGIMNMLMGERSSILSALPAGVGRALGFDREIREEARPLHEQERPIRVKQRSRFGPALIGTLAALALLFFLTRNRGRHEVRVEAPPAQEIQMPAATQPPRAMPTTPPSATYSEVDEFISGPGKESREFVLEGVTFTTGTAQLTPEGKAKVRELANVLKAHPNTVVRIEGHTDNKGGAAANRKLSLARANSVKSELVGAGATGTNINTKGVGQEHPVASNDTETGREQNRRTTLIVVKK